MISNPNRIEVALKIFDVIARADCEWVQSTVFKYVYDDVPYSVLRIVLFELQRRGILKAKQGLAGGYKMVRGVSIYELYEIFAPSLLPDVQRETCSRQLRATREQVIRSMKKNKVRPHKIAPLEFLLDDPTLKIVPLKHSR